MTKKIIWRLKEQPSSESLRELVKDGLLTKEEAREILFSQETEQNRSEDSLKSEIKFLRELIERLADKNQIITTIERVYVPYKQYDWYKPYFVWMGTTTNTLTDTGTFLADTTNNISFSQIQT